MKGWITLHRKIQENELWLNEPFTKGQAWVDLLLLANHKDQAIWKRGIRIVIKRGEIGWSEALLAKRWRWSRGKTRRFLFFLKTVQQIERENNHTLSRIIIKNYDKYQTNGTTDGTTDGTNNNNVNNVNNILSENKFSAIKNNPKNMPWKKYNEDGHYEEKAIDLETGEAIEDQDLALNEEERKEKALAKKYIKALRDAYQLPGLDAKQMNWQVKDYLTLRKRGWSHKDIGAEFIHIVSSDIWKEKMQNKEYPGMNTVEFNLRNKSK